MSTYAIGDLQGCLGALHRLLDLIEFDPKGDQLWFTGDLANRGPEPLQTLRFIKSLAGTVRCVLGNHDLALLALSFGILKPEPTDTYIEILAAPDSLELLDWLRQLPLLYVDQGYILVHAGIYPTWNLEDAKRHAHKIEQSLRSPFYPRFLEQLFSGSSDGTKDSPDPIAHNQWVISCFTRMRFCHPDGSLELQTKDRSEDPHLLPWFAVPGRACQEPILFGHWSALKGITPDPKLIALDTGCVWGGELTAFRLEDRQRFSVPGSKQ